MTSDYESDPPAEAGPTRHPVPPPFLDARDLFAAHAMAGLVQGRANVGVVPAQLAEAAYRLADAMLVQRTK